MGLSDQPLDIHPIRPHRRQHEKHRTIANMRRDPRRTRTGFPQFMFRF
jgi:hypothetical protein